MRVPPAVARALCGCALLLAGCYTVLNIPVAAEPFPRLPPKPDGVCPDFAGKYVPTTTSEETDSDGSFRTRDLGFGQPVTDLPERRKTIQPSGRYKLEPFEFTEVKHLDATTIEVAKHYSDGQGLYSYRARLIAKGEICDGGVLWREYTVTGGAELGSITTRTLERTSRERDGSIVKREYKQASGSALLVIPAGARREVFTFRFKPYVSP